MRRYIFNSEGGQDRSGKSEKISMTSPVKAEMLDGGYKVRWRSDCDQQTGGLSCGWRAEGYSMRTCEPASSFGSGCGRAAVDIRCQRQTMYKAHFISYATVSMLCRCRWLL